MAITYKEYVKLRRGDKIKVRGYVRTFLFSRGFRACYPIQKEISSCHWTNIQEVVEKAGE